MRTMWLTFLAAATLAVAGCGGASGSKFARILPASATLPPSGSIQFEATCSLEVIDVEWLADNGSLLPAASNGRFFCNYSAPASPGVYFMEARIETHEGNYFANAMTVVQ